jgi:AcrR family transcriptional regulator
MDQVAARSGVSKASLYLRWPNKTALVADAIRHQADVVRDIPDTGTLAGDMREFIHGLLRGKPLAERVLAAVQGEIHSNPELHAALRESAFGTIAARCRQVLDRAVARGELPASADTELLALLPMALLQSWTLAHGQPPGAAVVDRIVAQFYTAREES